MLEKFLKVKRILIKLCLKCLIRISIKKRTFKIIALYP